MQPTTPQTAPVFRVGQYVIMPAKPTIDMRVSAFYRVEAWNFYASDVYPGFLIREDYLQDANAFHTANAAAKQAGNKTKGE